MPNGNNNILPPFAFIMQATPSKLNFEATYLRNMSIWIMHHKEECGCYCINSLPVGLSWLKRWTNDNDTQRFILKELKLNMAQFEFLRPMLNPQIKKMVNEPWIGSQHHSDVQVLWQWNWYIDRLCISARQQVLHQVLQLIPSES